MKKFVLTSFLLVFALTSLYIPGASAARMMGKGKMMWCTESAFALKTAMRALWTEHVVYTRLYIVSALAGLDDAGAVATRLLKNQDEIGNAVATYYGSAAGKKLAGLLRDHIVIATEVVKAAESGSSKELAASQKKWTANADKLADFLAGANPNWSKAELQKMLHRHLELTTDEVVNRLKKNWNGDIAAYDRGYMHMMNFADQLSAGIIKQFPDKFAK